MTFQKNKRIYYIIATVSTLLIIGIIILLHSHKEKVEVKSVHWSHTTSVQRYQLVSDEGWEVPSGAENVENHGSRIHHYNRVVKGSHFERDYGCPKTTITSTCGREVTDYRDEPVYQTWCSWKIFAWRWNRDVVVSGNSIETWWANDAQIALNKNIQPRENEMAARTSATYTVNLIGLESGKKYEYNPETLEEFKSLFPSAIKTANISLIGITLDK